MSYPLQAIILWWYIIMLECQPGAESNAKILPPTIALAIGLKPSFPKCWVYC